MGTDGFSELEHTADWALQVTGADLADLFRHAAQGMLSLMRVRTVPAPARDHELDLAAADRESLLVAFLEDILYLLDASNLAPTAIEFRSLDERSLEARLTCLPVQEIEKEIKAVTFHNLAIKTTAAGFETVLVFDV